MRKSLSFITDPLSVMQKEKILFQELDLSPISPEEKAEALEDMGQRIFVGNTRLHSHCCALIDKCLTFFKGKNVDPQLRVSDFSGEITLADNLGLKQVGEHLAVCTRALEANPDKFAHYSGADGDHSFRRGALGTSEHQELVQLELEGVILNGSKTSPIHPEERISSASHEMLALQQESRLEFPDGTEPTLDLFANPSRYPILPAVKLKKAIEAAPEIVADFDPDEVQETPYVPLTGDEEEDNFLNRVSYPYSYRFFLHAHASEKFYTLRPPIPDLGVNPWYLADIAQNIAEQNYYLDFLNALGNQVLCSPTDMLPITVVLLSLKLIPAISPHIVGKIKSLLGQIVIRPVQPAQEGEVEEQVVVEGEVEEQVEVEGEVEEQVEVEGEVEEQVEVEDGYRLPDLVLEKIAVFAVLGRKPQNGEVLLVKKIQEEEPFYNEGIEILTTTAPRSLYLDIGNPKRYKKIFNFITTLAVEE